MDYSTLKKQISKEIAQNQELHKISKAITKDYQNGKISYNKVDEFAKKLGQTTSDILVKYGIPETEYAQYAEEIVGPVFRSMQKTSIMAGKHAQEVFNKKLGINLKPADVPTDESRIANIIKRFEEASKVEDVSFLIGKDVAENITRSAVIDSLKKNAQLLENVGFKTYAIRSGSGCCDWCDSMTGIYPIDDVPDDFWRIHKNCTCTFDYKCNGKHSRITYSTSDDGKISKNTEEL